ncbi:MAG: tRNA threonylcarbamoyladenosine dehydratase [Desulfocapsaceae bacterium]|nr:tRNA threonylcarbamoyladenosine dehydratase [Desulfocapsaceae bacterium]
MTEDNARYTRIIQLLGKEKFARLQRGRVTIVGLGAVGGHALEALARAGVGSFRLVDFDVLQPSNINRQILALTTNLNRSKVEVARERVLAINPDCKVETMAAFAAEDTTEKILQPPPDLLIDAIDSLNPKTQLLVAAYGYGIPTISSMGAALRTDPTQIQYGDIFDSRNCPLAKHLRKRLRRRQIGRGIFCVYSTEKVDFDYQQSEEPDNATPFADRGRQRNVLGSLPTLTGIFGLYIANQAILRLCQEDQ